MPPHMLLRLLAIVLVLLAALLPAAPPEARAQGRPPAANAGRDAIWQLGIGGQLYDDWLELTLTTRPATPHPLWTGPKTVPAAETWRCVNCHGWDYRGSARSGGEWGVFAGIPGLRNMTGRPPEVVAALIATLPRHGIEALPAEAREALAFFLAAGQDDTARLVARAAAGTGQWQEGAWHFTTTCALCHGNDGRRLNLGSDSRPAGIAALAVASPWKFLHAARFGHRGVMPSFVMLDDDAFVDLLAFATSRLPR